MNRGWALFKRNNFILTGRARKSSIKEENPQYCEPFRNKVLRFKTGKVNRMNQLAYRNMGLGGGASIYIESLFLHIETCQFLLLVPRFRPKNHQDVIAAAEDADQPKVWKLR